MTTKKINLKNKNLGEFTPPPGWHLYLADIARNQFLAWRETHLQAHLRSWSCDDRRLKAELAAVEAERTRVSLRIQEYVATNRLVFDQGSFKWNRRKEE